MSLSLSFATSSFLSDPCAHGVQSNGSQCLYIFSRGLVKPCEDLVKTVNVMMPVKKS